MIRDYTGVALQRVPRLYKVPDAKQMPDMMESFRLCFHFD